MELNKDLLNKIDEDNFQYGDYIISRNGKIYSTKVYAGQTKREVKYDYSSGNARATLSFGGKTKRYFVAKLIWFLFKDEDLEYYDFIDGNNENNSLDNIISLNKRKYNEQVSQKAKEKSLKRLEECDKEGKNYSKPKEIEQSEFKTVDEHRKEFYGYIITDNGEVINSKGMKMKPELKHGYHRVKLVCNGKSMGFFIHRLVANAFLEKEKEKHFINHKNGVRTDNNIKNLEWCNSNENMLHSYEKLNRPLSGNAGNKKVVYAYYKGVEYKSLNKLGEFLGLNPRSRKFKLMVASGEITRIDQ